MRQVEFVHVFIERKAVGLFLQHRDDRPGIYEPNKLGVFGGHIDPTDKNEEEAASRELYEETGLQAQPLKRLGTISVEGVSPSGERVLRVVHGFAIEVDPGVDIPVYEGQGGVTINFGQKLPVEPVPTQILRRELDVYYKDRFPK